MKKIIALIVTGIMLTDMTAYGAPLDSKTFWSQHKALCDKNRALFATLPTSSPEAYKAYQLRMASLPEIDRTRAFFANWRTGLEMGIVGAQIMLLSAEQRESVADIERAKDILARAKKNLADLDLRIKHFEEFRKTHP